MKINKKGFTLVELLVVIAIIGILSTVAVVNLNSARDKAKVASVKGNLAGLVPAVVLCHDNDLDITGGVAGAVSCSAGGILPVESTSMCGDPATDWPVLASGWIYKSTCNSAHLNGTWAFGACEGTGTTCTTAGVTIDCTDSGCVEDVT